MARERDFMNGSRPLEYVQDRVYLDQLLTGDPDRAKKIYRRIKLAWNAYGKHYQILTCSLPVSLKRKVYNRCIIPVLTYKAETWRLTKKLEKLRSAQTAMERKMLCVTLRYRKTAVWIKEQTGVADILVEIKKCIWACLEFHTTASGICGASVYGICNQGR